MKLYLTQHGAALPEDEHRGAIGFRPGGLACLEREGSGPWTLTGMLRPDWLVS